MGYIVNIEEETMANDFFRKVLHTAGHSQLVVMSLKPKEEIGEEVHRLDQFIRIESGEGEAVLDGKRQAIHKDDAIVIPEGTLHNIINTSPDSPMKLYTIYSPPEHKPGTIHKTKEDAVADEHDVYEGTA